MASKRPRESISAVNAQDEGPNTDDYSLDSENEIVPISVNEAYQKIQEFSRFLSTTIVIDKDATDALAESQNLLQIASEKEADFTHQIAHNKETARLLQIKIARQAAIMNELRICKLQSEQKIRDHLPVHDELLKIRSILKGAQGHFTDSVLHNVTGQPFLTTTGQVKLKFTFYFTGFRSSN